MRIGLKLKVILLFLSVAFLPVIVNDISLGLFLTTYDKNSAGWEFSNLDILCHDTFEDISKEYYLLDLNYEAFSNKVEPLLKELGGELQIIDNNGYILYDSKDREKVTKHTQADIVATAGYDPEFERDNPGLYKHSYPITEDNKLIATASIIKETKKFKNGLGGTLQNYMTISSVLSKSVLVLLALFSILYISKYILTPLKQLNNAVTKIGNGDLDFEITYNRRDEIGGFCIAFETMRKKLKESLVKQNQYEVSRKETLATITHELRTPISLISGYVEGLEVGIAKDEKQLKRYLSVIKEKTLALNRLINDLLLVTQLDLGKFKMSYEVVKSQKFFNKLFNLLSLQYENKSVRLTLPEVIPEATLNIDQDRIKQVVENLLQNSIKHIGTDGEIAFRLSILNNCLHVSVEDNGQGIAAEDLPHIFDKFFRGEKSRSRDYGGAGLGLAICKEIIEEHGGQIYAESVPEIRTVFTFTIPILDENINVY